jgi:hypothetical protein
MSIHVGRWRLLIGPAALVAGLSLFPFRPLDRPAHTATPAQDEKDSRQVTVFGIEATPGKAHVDPALLDVAPQLRKLLPDHGFRLLASENQRAVKGEKLSCDLGDTLKLTIDLRNRLTPDGKVVMGVRLDQGEKREALVETEVSTPPNQLCFLEKKLDGRVLLIGLGAR